MPASLPVERGGRRERWKEGEVEGGRDGRKEMGRGLYYNIVLHMFRVSQLTFPTIPMPTLAACIMLTSFPPSPGEGRKGGRKEGRKGGEEGREERKERKEGRRGRRGRKGGEGVNSLGRRRVKGGASHQSKEVERLGKKGVKWEGSTYRRHRLVSWCVF